MWRLDGPIAQYDDSQISWKIQLDAPRQGIQLPRLPGLPSELAQPMRLLAIDADGASLGDVYVRGHDLIATYCQTAAQQCALEIYWRGLRAPAELQVPCHGLELVLSVQTTLLDGNPLLQVHSHLQAAEVAEQENWMLAHGAVGSWHFLQMAHPSNHGSTRFEVASPLVTVHHTFFPGRIEKGVIRRGRLQCWFLGGDKPAEAAAALWNAFRNSPPPLTT